MGKWVKSLDEEPPDMSIDTCPDCDGDSDPIDDLYYCGMCKGLGWIYVQQYESVYLSQFDIEEWNKEYNTMKNEQSHDR